MIRHRTRSTPVFTSILDSLGEELGESYADSETYRPTAQVASSWSLAFPEGAAQSADVVRKGAIYSDELSNSTPDQAFTTDIDDINRELDLEPNLDADEVGARRRRFARRNHPDRLPAELRETATIRMMIANELCDRYLEVNAAAAPKCAHR